MAKRKLEGKGRPEAALVLAGGGARGAYEAGVLLYVLEGLRLTGGMRPAFSIYAGTSIGALNAAFLAAMADDPARGAGVMGDYWRNLTMDRVLVFGRRELAGLADTLAGRQWFLRARPSDRPRPAASPHPPVAGVFATPPVGEELRRLIPWERLGRNLSSGRLRAIALCTTEVCTGRSVVFYDSRPGVDFHLPPDPTRLVRRSGITLEHALASAAIPFVFPAVQIDGTCYVDGGFQQNTPIMPAMRLGADRLMVVSLRQRTEHAYLAARASCRRNRFPGFPFLLGRVIGAVLNETLDFELKRIEMFNSVIRTGTELYGDSFIDQINGVTSDYRNARYRLIESCLIRPSHDPCQLARDALARAPGEVRIAGRPGRLIERFLFRGPLAESELLSHLLFTPTYLRALIDLGFEDARQRRDELKAFFGG